jgi:hypothetical protein
MVAFICPHREGMLLEQCRPLCLHDQGSYAFPAAVEFRRESSASAWTGETPAREPTGKLAIQDER